MLKDISMHSAYSPPHGNYFYGFFYFCHFLVGWLFGFFTVKPLWLLVEIPQVNKTNIGNRKQKGHLLDQIKVV